MTMAFSIEPESIPEDLVPIAKDIQKHIGEMVSSIKKTGNNEYQVHILGMFATMTSYFSPTGDSNRPWNLRDTRFQLANRAFDPNEVIARFKKLTRSADLGKTETKD